jgi:hypothetical protein
VALLLLRKKIKFLYYSCLWDDMSSIVIVFVVSVCLDD